MDPEDLECAVCLGKIGKSKVVYSGRTPINFVNIDVVKIFSPHDIFMARKNVFRNSTVEFRPL